MRYHPRVARRPLRVLPVSGVLHPWVLEQRRVWVDTHGQEHRIHEMDIGYVFSVHRFVQRRLMSYVALYSDWRGLDGEIFECGETAMGWLHERPLMRVLAGRIERHERECGIVRDHLMRVEPAVPSLAVALTRPRRNAVLDFA